MSTGVLVESLTGDHRRDFLVNRLVRKCVVRPVTDLIARHAATLRHTAKARVSAIDAIVAATADHAGGGLILTSDPKDMSALAANTIARVRVSKV
ncbi:MAG TPA: PIN domain-containing protein [Actinophytocola sp.]|uniref:type II toxin-antitoxin system VapC family toxin n=1 Tax=Actinophytocola sp. TaxID=1872138 RepID=UPI002DBB5DBB|nr:PIN domain-containing protein [Actinophytocola sp.]HEU5473000.1 PIN domain-containing protein [Actinophytocola sp.]